jgi:transposase InsO family protein
MPWMEAFTVCLRQEFVSLAIQPRCNLAALCRRFAISRKTAYKWMHRAKREGDGVVSAQEMADRSRRPLLSPTRTVESLERRVCELRRAHGWGGRKIHARLKALGCPGVPAISTVTDILRRNDLLNPEESGKHTAFVRFEHPRPNDLWQMDFLGHFPLDGGGRCHALTVLDDHSRFCLGVRACSNEQGITVQKHLIDLFRRYGLPLRILCDNGSPWGGYLSSSNGGSRHTWLSAWLIRLDVRVGHGRAYHPQTQGKDERFNRTVKAEAIGTRRFHNTDEVQRRFDPWRDIYNLERPHEALEMATPVTRYVHSSRAFPETLPPIEYGPSDVVRKVQKDGYFRYKSTRFKISQAFTGYPVALRPTMQDGQLDVFFCHMKVATVDMKSQTRV